MRSVIDNAEFKVRADVYNKGVVFSVYRSGLARELRMSYEQIDCCREDWQADLIRLLIGELFRDFESAWKLHI